MTIQEVGTAINTKYATVKNEWQDVVDISLIQLLLDGIDNLDNAIVNERFVGYSYRNDGNDIIFGSVLKLLRDKLALKSYLYYSQPYPLLKSKTRSYKGILPKKSNEVFGIEAEIDFDEHYSIFCAVAELDDSTFLKEFFVPNNAFLLLSSQPCLLDKNELVEIYIKSQFLPRKYWVNYSYIIPRFCNDNTMVGIFSLDINDENTMAIDFFLKNENKQKFIEDLKRI